ncbi:MAG TPA: nicotinate-nicotinamide nucleotide adenylyltransferase [Polyangiaceae bacterium]|nr:nicotinate-nicotinamide nucleotide adenylyltransferase [Polyangiaceae bacterium]
MPRIAVYGGSFDPPHVAHLLAAAYALAIGAFDELLVIPVFAHPFQKRLSSFEHRTKMCELAFAELEHVTVSRIEAELPLPSRTLSTLEALKRERPFADLSLIVGSDVLAETSKWHAFDQVLRLAPAFVIGRSGYPHAQASAVALPAVSSTRVRELLGCVDTPGALEELAQLVPARVLDYALRQHLYSVPPAAGDGEP